MGSLYKNAMGGCVASEERRLHYVVSWSALQSCKSEKGFTRSEKRFSVSFLRLPET